MANDNEVKFEVQVQDNATSVLQKIKRNLDDFGNAVKDNANKLKGWAEDNKQTFTNMRNYGMIVTGVITMLGKSFLDTAGKFQKYDAVLSNTLQSSSEAKEVMDMIVEVASKTPFEIDGLTASYVKLANRGIKPTREEIVKLGDLAASTGKDFDQLTEALLDAQTGEFERLKEFGVKASKQGDQVAFTFKGVTTTVKMSDKAIKDYIMSLGDLKGVSGSMLTISQTWEGAMSNLRDSLTGVSRSIGESLLPVIQPLILKVTEFLGKVGEWASQNPEIVKKILIFAGAVAGLVTVLGTLGLAIGPIITALTVLSGPIGIIIAAVGLLATAWIKDWGGIREFTIPLVKEIWETIQTTFETIKAYISQFTAEVQAARNEFLMALGITNDQFWNGFKMVVTTIFEGIKLYLQTTFAFIKTMFSAELGAIKTFVTGFLGGLKDIIVGGIMIIKGFLGGGGREMVEDGFKKMFGGIIKIVLAPINALIGIIEGMINATIAGINKMIGAANKIPGVSIGNVGNVTLPRIPVPQFAEGGIVDRPTLGMIGEGGQNEAVVPLPNGRSIPVDMRGQQGITINIGNLYGTDRETAVRFANEMVGQFKRQFMFEQF